MPNFYPARKHVSILTQLFSLFIFASISVFALAHPKSAFAVCRPKGLYPPSGIYSCAVYGAGNNFECSTGPNAGLCCASQTECNTNTSTPQGCVLGPTCASDHPFACQVHDNVAQQEKNLCCTSSSACDKQRMAVGITSCTAAGDKMGECNACMSKKGIWTALGCIPFEQDSFVVALVQIIIGIAGFIALAMMITGAVIYMTGGGNPEQIKKGREIFTGAIIGILFIIFSVVVLQIITRDIIKLDITSQKLIWSKLS